METIIITLNLQINKADLLAAIEKNETLVLNLNTGGIELESERFFHDNKEKILFLMQSIKNIDISTQNKNVLNGRRIEYLFQIAEQWPQVIKFEGLGGKSTSNLIEMFQKVGLDLWDPKLLLIAAAKEKLNL